MAIAKTAYRKNAIGISAGLGIAAPLAAYAATLPFDGVNEIVRMDAMPFAAGILAGVGMLAVTGHVLDARADRVADEEVRDIPSGLQAFAHMASQEQGSGVHEESARRGSRFVHGASDDVPVISRAANALDEAAAWTDIDAVFDDTSPVNCDPAHSNDVYQIAFEELRRSAAVTDAPASVQGSAYTSPSAGSTAMYMSLAGVPQAASAAAAPVSSTGATYSTSAAATQASNAFAGTFMPYDDLDEVSDYQAAIESLYGPKSCIPQQPIISAPTSATAAGAVAPTPAAASPIASSVATHEVNVPAADYSGHEDMWAAALAILDEEELPVAEPRFVPNDAASAEAARMAAVAEGENATKLHSRVNSLIEEEFEHVESKSVRRTTHEYLKVIEGGTAAMPALKRAEA
ncbi:hypothetical protein [Collinsella provencensis]|uniref:hypothetical protein n=1 Tax=Collinsella provencensis TaxID=1937461 RepID=UPI000C845038|nr:hypothetical protein [Collinsella provencensis]